MIMRSAAAIRFFTPEICSQLPPTHPQLSRSHPLRQGPARLLERRDLCSTRPIVPKHQARHPARDPVSGSTSSSTINFSSRPMYAPRASANVSPAPVPQKRFTSWERSHTIARTSFWPRTCAAVPDPRAVEIYSTTLASGRLRFRHGVIQVRGAQPATFPSYRLPALAISGWSAGGTGHSHVVRLGRSFFASYCLLSL